MTINRFLIHAIFITGIALGTVEADSSVSAAETEGVKAGSICFVLYGRKVTDPLENEAQFVIDQKTSVPLLGDTPRLLAEGLDLKKKHTLELRTAGKTWQSWTVRFQPGITMVNLRRSAGSWHLEPNSTGRCEETDR